MVERAAVEAVLSFKVRGPCSQSWREDVPRSDRLAVAVRARWPVRPTPVAVDGGWEENLDGP